MRKLTGSIVAPVAVIALTAGLAGCSSAEGGEDGSGDGDALTVWIMGDTGTSFEEIAEGFTEESGTEVKVEAIPWANLNDKITTSIASGSGPDVIQIGLSVLPTLADAEALLPLDDLLADHPALAAENFADAIAGGATQIGGETLSVPWVADTRVLFYRSDILAEAGFDAAPATWDELTETATALAGRGEGQYGYYIPQWDSSLPVAWTWAAGGEVVDADGNVDFDNPGFYDMVDLYTGMYAEGLVPTNADFDQVQGFVSGVAPMLVSGPYLAKSIEDAAPELEGKWAAAPMPSKVDNTSLFAGSNLGIWHNSKNVDGALALLEYMADPEVQLEWYGKVNELPTNKSALADPRLAEDPNVAVYVETLDNARVLPMVPNWDAAVGQKLTDALNAIALTGADREQTLDAFFAETDGLAVK
jgi:multiple sugar transport system substrate-binding protein